MIQSTMQDGRDAPNPYPMGERIGRVIWWFADKLLFRPVPRHIKGWHSFLLRLFGAKIGKGVCLYNSAKIAIPWMLELDDYSVVGDRVTLYSLGKIHIGTHTILSQGAHICAGTHDYTDRLMPLLRKPIRIGNGCWICAEAFVGPNTNIGDMTVVGARSVVVSDLPEGMICAGNPCKVIKPRIMRNPDTK